MSQEPPGRSCPECGGPLRQILFQSLFGTLDFAYADARTSWVHGGRAKAGIAQPWLCPRCERVLIYALVTAQPHEVTPSLAPEGKTTEVTAADPDEPE